MADIIQKSFNSSRREIKYLNRDFSSFKSSLIEYSKTYFPRTYKDFSEASPGMMFIEMASYIGDVLSYYTDYQFKESLMPYAEERKNVLALANYLGYKTKPTKSATTNIDLYQLIPSTKDSNNNYIPDNNYALKIREYMEVSNESGVSFITTDPVDFSLDSKFSPREVTVYSRDNYGVPQFFLLKKSVKVIAGKITTKSFTVGTSVPFYKISLSELNVIDIIDVRDSDNNKWYEVDYLAQDLVFTETENTDFTNNAYVQYSSEVPKLIKSFKTSRKFVVNVTANNVTYLEFGAGTDATSDEVIYPNSELVGIGLTNISNLNLNYDTSKLLNSETFGQAPSNTVLTVQYLVGGGILSNSPSDTIKNISSVTYLNDTTGLTPSQNSLLTTVKNSLRISNPNPAVGGQNEESVEEIRQNALANFGSQNRTVTVDDYVSRIYSIPPRFGSIAKVMVIPNSDLSISTNQTILNGFVNNENQTSLINNSLENNYRKVNFDVSNPFSLNLYVLSYNSNKNLTQINEALVYNIRQYLQKYKIISDSVNIIDGYIINVGVDFKILVYNNFNKKEVLDQCLQKAKDFFNIDKWYFNQPININQLELELAKVEGVQSVAEIKFKNLTQNDGNYSPHEYNLSEATHNKIIYPSLDPSVFEVKYPDNDIRGAVI
jgi:hypothetical protein